MSDPYSNPPRSASEDANTDEYATQVEHESSSERGAADRAAGDAISSSAVTEAAAAQHLAGRHEPVEDAGSSSGAATSTGSTSAVGSAGASRGSAGTAHGMRERAGQAANTAKDEASGVMSDVKASAGDVAETTSEEAGKVAQEAKRQGASLLHEAAGNLRSQTETGKERAASGLRSLSDELASLAEGSQQQGMATDLAHQASERLDGVARFLEDRDLDGVLADVSDFARRRPMTFFAIAVGAGMVVGRMARALKDAPSGSHEGRRAGRMSSQLPVYEESEVVVDDYSTADVEPLTGATLTGDPLADDPLSGSDPLTDGPLTGDPLADRDPLTGGSPLTRGTGSGIAGGPSVPDEPGAGGRSRENGPW